MEPDAEFMGFYPSYCLRELSSFPFRINVERAFLVPLFFLEQERWALGFCREYYAI